jgi:outer membrane protein OmpA-like peptidoglycan-associated protein|tara:strand:- start:2467 stop:3174 length:708 start_codon:yes stop_codon:yes gene_type:complete
MDENELEQSKDQEGHWVAVSDLMAGLMMIFMLISVVFMVDVETERNRIQDVAILYDHLRQELYKDLQEEFADDLPKWGAELDKDLSFRFNDSEILFDNGKSELKQQFQTILADFFPRYMNIITRDAYHDDILEVRIEGHTSTGWLGAYNEDDAYIRNMDLSQARTRSTLAFVMGLDEVKQNKDWLKQYLTANGLSSAKVIRDAQGNEDKERSRRVEFKVRTDADSRIATILDQVL